MRKSLFTVFLVAALIFVGGQLGRAEAGEVYMGNYSDGSAVYLLTQSVSIRSYRPYTFTCTVRAGYDYLNYSFYPVNGSPYYRNSEGYEGYVNGGQSPVASNIYSYVVRNW